MATVSVAARVRGSLRRLLILATLIPLGACASFDGHPQPVIALNQNVDLAAKYPVDQALTNFYALKTVQERTEYRDKIIGIYIVTADARYQQFRRLLSREVKGSNFGLGTGALALSTVASVAAERAANILSAGAAALSGAKTGLSKEVYFEKTLPALMAGMEANRTRVRTTILERMQKPADTYTLAHAFLDLSNYETAASLDSAIDMVTREASNNVVQATNAYEGVKLTLQGAPEEGSIAPAEQIGTLILKLEQAGDNVTLARIAKELGVDPGADAAATAQAIREEVDEADTAAEAKALLERITKAAAPPSEPADDDGTGTGGN